MILLDKWHDPERPGEFLYPSDPDKACSYDSAQALIQVGMLGFCGCGSPSLNLEFILTGLDALERKSDAETLAEKTGILRMAEEIAVGQRAYEALRQENDRLSRRLTEIRSNIDKLTGGA